VSVRFVLFGRSGPVNLDVSDRRSVWLVERPAGGEAWGADHTAGRSPLTSGLGTPDTPVKGRQGMVHQPERE
jgi:hypothetical protein